MHKEERDFDNHILKELIRTLKGVFTLSISDRDYKKLVQAFAINYYA